MNRTRQLPPGTYSDPAAERALLGYYLQTTGDRDDLRAEVLALELDLVTVPKHRTILTAMQHVAAAGDPLDLVTLSQRLRVTAPDLACSTDLLDLVEQAGPTPPPYRRILTDCRARRDLDAILLVSRNNLTNGDRPEDVARQALDALSAQPVEASTRFPLLTVEDLIARPLPPSLIAGVLPQGVIAVLAGEGGAGKSFTALDWSLSIVTGLSWQGHAVQQGSVVYLLAETDPFFSQRIAAWRAHHQVPASALSGFRILPDVVSPFRDLDVHDFVASVGTLDPPPVLIVVDTVAVSIAGHDENASETMSSLVDFAHALRRAFGCSVLLLHHPSLQGHLVRGHSSLECNVDLIVRLKAQDDLIALYCDKDRHAPPFPPIYMRLQKIADDDGAPLSAVLAPSERHAAGAEVLPVTGQTVLARLVTLARTQPDGVRSTDWRKATTLSHSTFNDWVRVLTKRKLVTKGDTKRGRFLPTPAAVVLVSANEVAMSGMSGGYPDGHTDVSHEEYPVCPPPLEGRTFRTFGHSVEGDED
jgi:hypothetical protein